LIQLVGSLPASLSARETTERLLDGVHGFLDGVEPGDDMTIMVLRVLEPNEERPPHDGPAVDATKPATPGQRSRQT
jgi:hypothetical protein